MIKEDPSRDTLLEADSEALESDPFANLEDGIFMIGEMFLHHPCSPKQ